MDRSRSNQSVKATVKARSCQTAIFPVREDEFGYMLAEILKENNENIEGTHFDPGARAFVTLRTDGEREFMFYRNPSADMLLQEAEIDLDFIRNTCKNISLWLHKSYNRAMQISEEEISFLTKGEDPYDDAEFSGRVKGVKVDAVDTTGAGDAFVAGILSQLAKDLSLLQNEDRLKEALKFANACGALTVKARGSIPALPTREAVNSAIIQLVG
ncbi:hypothetical protein DKX38_005869 [Salix brachista]|uniref:Carbohydrate kinase PfkB domain-containing protein n=1 Tax=Salix brachista TaxID=2182728 RepID=A0A5N5N132_9ROSI|nr:hypothetical protein DKX38_005869 [Salix brachista]